MQPSGTSPEEVDPITKLRGLSQDQLTSLLTELILKRPDIKEEVKRIIPEPDIAAMEENLNYLKRNIYKTQEYEWFVYMTLSRFLLQRDSCSTNTKLPLTFEIWFRINLSI